MIAILILMFLTNMVISGESSARAAKMDAPIGLYETSAQIAAWIPLHTRDFLSRYVNGRKTANLYHYLENRLRYRIARAKNLRRMKYRKRIAYPFFYNGNPYKKTVALTFDDGPHPASALKILAILRKEKIKATFFVVGKMAEKCPDIVRLEADEGHEIANHTYNHTNLTRLPENKVSWEWKKCNNIIESIIGYKPGFCRPPGGNYNYVTVDAAKKEGLTLVLWTDDPGDYLDVDKGFLMDKFRAYMCNGAVIIMHDGGKYTTKVLPEMIKYLKDRGYKFQTVSEMARDLYGKGNKR